ncbi:Der GTPase-activating protein YihI [Thorsellia kenyensis]|uniref:Der GTPase-activating protein YihI n=1 Tax=Thorsellia kenyensis TaxID=1549888 RepID=A0ABV6CHT8_9GAMM
MKKNASNYVKQNGKKKYKKDGKKTRAELNEEARKQKKLKNRKGLPAGSRHQEVLKSSTKKDSGRNSDPRIGSKVKIDLSQYALSDNLNFATVSEETLENNGSSMLDSKARGLLEKELVKLEASTRLEQLLLKEEEGEELSEAESLYVEETLDRISELYDILGIEILEETTDDEEYFDEENKGDDLMRLLKS